LSYRYKLDPVVNISKKIGYKHVLKSKISKYKIIDFKDPFNPLYSKKLKVSFFKARTFNLSKNKLFQWYYNVLLQKPLKFSSLELGDFDWRFVTKFSVIND
jgi:hypothetical protein